MMGKLLWAIQAWDAEMENEERSEAVRAGQARARAAGKKIGRPRAIFRRDVICDLRRQGLSWRQIAHRLGVGVGTVRRAYGLDSSSPGAFQNCVPGTSGETPIIGTSSSPAAPSEGR